MQPRQQLTTQQRAEFFRLKQGYRGETLFYQLLRKYNINHFIPLFDIQMEVHNSECQFDCLLISSNILYHLEIKHLNESYYIKDDQWFLKSGKEITNMEHQLARANIFLKNFLQNNHIKVPIKSLLVFTNPSFYLFQAPPNIPAIFPNHLSSFLQELKDHQNTINSFQTNIRDKITSTHINQSKYKVLPQLSHETTRKGLFCKNCSRKLQPHTTRKFICPKCLQTKNKRQVLLESVYDFSRLFPDKKVTVSLIYDWIGGSIPRRTIQYHLSNNMDIKELSTNSHYIFKG